MLFRSGLRQRVAEGAALLAVLAVEEDVLAARNVPLLRDAARAAPRKREGGAEEHDPWQQAHGRSLMGRRRLALGGELFDLLLRERGARVVRSEHEEALVSLDRSRRVARTLGVLGEREHRRRVGRLGRGDPLVDALDLPEGGLERGDRVVVARVRGPDGRLRDRVAARVERLSDLRVRSGAEAERLRGLGLGGRSLRVVLLGLPPRSEERRVGKECRL